MSVLVESGDGQYGCHMADFSFDIVSKADRMEVDNAVNQAIREIATRFDFKNTGAEIEYKEDKIKVTADTEERCKAALDVVKDKWVKRQLSLKQLDTTEPVLSGKTYSITATIKEGISSENAKKVSKLIRDEGPKSVKSQIQGDELRVSSKSKDDLQETMAMIKAKEFDFAVQFTNFR
jgi:cyclic-di-GMP-binding protein